MLVYQFEFLCVNDSQFICVYGQITRSFQWISMNVEFSYGSPGSWGADDRESDDSVLRLATSARGPVTRQDDPDDPVNPGWEKNGPVNFRKKWDDQFHIYIYVLYIYIFHIPV